MIVRRTLLAAGLLVLLGASALTTYALWGKQIDVPVGIVTAGNLDLQLVGNPQWADTSDDVTSPGSIAVLPDATTAVRLATPGDTYTFTQEFRTVLEGDNLAARVTVDWDPDTPPALDPAGRVTATYTLTTPGGATTPYSPLGESITFPGTPDNLTPEEIGNWPAGSTWRVTVTLDYAGTDVLVTPAQAQAAANPVTDLGRIRVMFNQVRDGEGFDSP